MKNCNICEYWVRAGSRKKGKKIPIYGTTEFAPGKCIKPDGPCDPDIYRYKLGEKPEEMDHVL